MPRNVTPARTQDDADVRRPLRVAVVTDRSTLEELRPQWLDLVSRSPGSSAFSTPGATLSWYRHVERHSGVYALTIWQDDDLVGLAPFSVLRLGPYRLFCSAGSGYGFYGGPLLGSDPTVVASAMADHISRLIRSGTAAVYLRRLPVDGPLLTTVAQRSDLACHPMGADETNSIVRFDQMPNPDDYFARVARKHAIPRRSRRLAEHVHHMEFLTSDPEPDAALRDMRDMLHRRFGTDLRMFRGAHNTALTQDLVRELISDGHAKISSIMTAERRASVTVNLQVGSRMFWYAVAYDPDFSSFSIGHLELYQSLRAAFEASVTEVDLGSAGFAYKRRWATDHAHHRTVAITAPRRWGTVANNLRRATISLHRRLMRASRSGPEVV